jgi:hypothetical protein
MERQVSAIAGVLAISLLAVNIGLLAISLGLMRIAAALEAIAAKGSP